MPIATKSQWGLKQKVPNFLCTKQRASLNFHAGETYLTRRACALRKRAAALSADRADFARLSQKYGACVLRRRPRGVAHWLHFKEIRAPV
jgi:hypothetical protein